MIASRIRLGLLVAVGNTIVALLYAQVGTELFAVAENHTGPFSHLIDTIQTVIPPLIGVFYLFAAAIIIVGAIQYERSRTTRTRRQLR
jgi:hypothetical protein